MKKKLIVMGIAATVAFFTSFGIGYAGSPCADILIPGDSIQAAITAASAGDKICVEPGTYTEDLSITKSIELAGRDGATIQGVATVPAASFPLAAPNINIRANDVSIHGFTIKSPVVDAVHYSSGMVLTGANITIFNNNFLVGTGDGSQGIQTWNTVANTEVTPHSIAGLKIINNQFSPLTPVTGIEAYEGIYINPQNEAVGSSLVVIENNRFLGGVVRAITTERSKTVIRNNRMSTDSSILSAPFPMGIYLRAGTNHSVLGNKVDDSGTEVFNLGISVRGGVTNSQILKNEVNSVSQYGIEVRDGATSITVKSNRVRNSGSFDLFDANVNCDDNIWGSNIFGNSNNDTCIH